MPTKSPPGQSALWPCIHATDRQSDVAQCRIRMTTIESTNTKLTDKIPRQSFALAGLPFHAGIHLPIHNPISVSSSKITPVRSSVDDVIHNPAKHRQDDAHDRHR